jgi:hypothetical protein
MDSHEDFKLDKVHKTSLSREFTSTDKEWYEERPTKELSVKLSNIWIDEIPKTPPLETSTTIEVIKDLTLTEDFTVEGHRTWFTCEEQGLLNTRLEDFIQPSKGQSIKYHVKVYDAVGKQVYIGEELEWEFDYNNGILIFKENPTVKYTMPFKVSAYRYIGRLGNLEDLAGSGGNSIPPTLDKAYDGVDGIGSGRVIEADSGPVVIKASNGYAPLQLSNIDYIPINGVEGGQIMHRNGIAYIYDESRSTFLSMFRQAIAFGSKRADGVMMNISNFSSNMSGWPALRNGMIVGVTAQAAGGYSRKQIDVGIKGGENLLSFNLFDFAYANGSLDLPFEENDLIQVKVSSQYEVTYNLVLNLEIAWRL